MDHVYFGYTPQKTVLKDISLNIPAGTKVAVVGPTGSGKTTLINLLTRFYDVSEGSIRLDGHDLREYRMVRISGFAASISFSSDSEGSRRYRSSIRALYWADRYGPSI